MAWTKTTAASSRRLYHGLRSVSDHYGSALPHVENIEPNGHVFILTLGRLTLERVVLACLEQSRPADVDMMMWSLGHTPADKLAKWQADGSIRRLRLVLDGQFRAFNVERYDSLRAQLGPESVRVCPAHAKLVTVRGQDWNFCIRGSLNLSGNPRVEQIDVSDDKGACELVADVFDRIWECFGKITLDDLDAEGRQAAAADGKRVNDTTGPADDLLAGLDL